MKKLAPKVWIVGAGPGDPELISVKGLKVIQRADVILYDALAAASLLEYAPIRCKKIFVGKRKGKKEFPQDEINQLIVFYAIRYGEVVRLKGGDPHVFGRGQEEVEYVRKRGLDVEVIPGISSSIAGPAAAGIPLTKRGINESFWVITGTLSSGEMSNDILLAAQTTATVVILMGISHLKNIADVFRNLRSADEPVALIQEATTKHQKVAIGTVSNIVAHATELGITSPAVIVIGKVVNERDVEKTLKFCEVESLRKID